MLCATLFLFSDSSLFAQFINFSVVAIVPFYIYPVVTNSLSCLQLAFHGGDCTLNSVCRSLFYHLTPLLLWSKRFNLNDINDLNVTAQFYQMDQTLISHLLKIIRYSFINYYFD